MSETAADKAVGEVGKAAAGKLLGEIGKAAAQKFAMGMAGVAVDAILDLFGLGPPPAEELLRQAVQQFSQVVRAELEQSRLEEACASLAAIEDGLRALCNQIESSGPNWWEGPLGVDRISSLTQESRDLLRYL